MRLLKRITFLAAIACLTLLQTVSAATITHEQWSRPRSGQMIVSLPQLGELIARLDRFPGRRIELQFNRSDDGVLWAEELKSWLVALGVSSNRIVLIPGLQQSGMVEIRIGSGSAIK